MSNHERSLTGFYILHLRYQNFNICNFYNLIIFSFIIKPKTYLHARYCCMMSFAFCELTPITLENGPYFVQLAFNMSNRVTDTLESSTILIYLVQVKGIYTQKG